MHEQRSRSERILECFKGFPTFFGKVPSNILASKPGKGNYDIRVVIDETTIEICESKEGLDILDFPGLRPVKDSLDLLGRNG
jgi:hypothetical protein